MDAYAVKSEGHIRDILSDEVKNITVVTSYWMTEAEAQYAIDRQFERNFGSWTPLRRWVELVSDVAPDKVSNLDWKH